MAQIQVEIPLLLLPPASPNHAAATGNNAAWLCPCGRLEPLLGRSARGDDVNGIFTPAITEAGIVRCPDCEHVYLVIGDKSQGSAVSVQELRREQWPNAAEYALTKSGVRVLNDFRDNLILDRNDPAFATMRKQKLWHLRSENSEDALTWNVFQTLRHIDPGCWFTLLFQRAFPTETIPKPDGVTVRLWPSLAPPPSLGDAGFKEGLSEIDVVIESSTLVWVIEAKFRSDISLRTKHNENRDQIVRNVDVGSHYAGMRPFYFSLLVLNEANSKVGVERIEKYADSRDELLSQLSHREDALQNLRQAGLLTWAQVALVLADAEEGTSSSEDKARCSAALNWLAQKGIVPSETH